ncbi:hypothetical protein [Pseudomonas chlororaphis]|uniref:hypothetical protein n=1 Tax=Pseudomonas chlororaphis TaxID=587753 RepID=UPI000F56D467|nr:hypothetical protein [Pseudomonas chlororaphis]WDG75332.1 hypothetical protein PUP65_13485 [Pseudomonas chlororaphis]WDH27032.1 hypothetical protein PUP81_20825 [Pseudomonas chlororaphis]WDH73852.1 hypothetical protein PUP78_13480 [Pseudomonas chlororaphis]
MLAPVIFISLRVAPRKAPNALGGCRLKRSPAPINIFSIYFLRGIFFPINFFKAGPGSVHRFSRLPMAARLKIFPAPTL